LKGIPSRYKPSTLTEKHWCPVCQCQSDPGKQFDAIVKNNLRLVKEVKTLKENQRDLIKTAEDYIVFLGLRDAMLKIPNREEHQRICSLLEEAILKARSEK